MNKYIFRALALTVFLLFPWNISQAETDAPEDSREALHVRCGIYQNPPKIYLDETGEPRGFFPDIIDYIARSENWDIEYVEVTFDEGLTMLSEGALDMMPDVAWSAKRSTDFLFNCETVISDWGRIYSRTDIRIDEFSNLDGLRIAVMKGGIHNIGPQGIRVLSETLDFNPLFIEEDNYEDVFESLRDGRADAGVVNRIFGMQHRREYGVIRTPLMVSPISIRFIFRKDDPRGHRLSAVVDAHLSDIKENPFSIYYRSFDKHIGGEFMAQLRLRQILNILAVLIIFLAVGAVVLKTQVARRTGDLKKANLELMSLEKTKKELLSNVSHEFKTPLAAIRLYCELILRGTSGPVTATQKRQLKVVIDNIDELDSLVGEMLALSRLRHSPGKYDPKPFDLATGAETVVDHYRATALERKINLNMEISGGPFSVMGEENEIEKVFRSLIDNAIKFTPEGGRVNLVLRKKKNRVIGEVSDTGSGIPREKISKIFSGFYQADTSTSRKFTGMGLGLALSREIIALHGGRIKISSRMGKGTKVVFHLPLHKG